ncbi:MAG: hypothetical protein RR617_07380 [Anaerovoracaceae bacterium]
MQIKKITSETELPTTATKVFTEEELKREYNYYLAQQLLNKLLNEGIISSEELHKITEINRKTFSPSLAQIMT